MTSDQLPKPNPVLSIESMDLDAQGIAQATFFCQENGLMPALLLANQAPERVANIVGISASPPYRTLAQTNAMPSKQRLFVWAAQNAQWMIRLLIRLGMVQLRKLGPERWLRSLHPRCGTPRTPCRFSH